MPNRLTRILRHLWFDESDAHKAIPPDMARRLKQRVVASEQRHDGQIRICVEAGLPVRELWRKEPMGRIVREHAVALFGELRVWDTEANNGVLIYLLLAEHAIELVADRGLNRHVPPHEWQALAARMGSALSGKRFEDGLTQALEEVSALLVRYFPRAPGEMQRNELPDAPLIR